MCSLIADLELAALDLCSASRFSRLRPDSPIYTITSAEDAGRSGESAPVSVIFCSVEAYF